MLLACACTRRMFSGWHPLVLFGRRKTVLRPTSLEQSPSCLVGGAGGGVYGVKRATDFAHSTNCSAFSLRRVHTTARMHFAEAPLSQVVTIVPALSRCFFYAIFWFVFLPSRRAGGGLI